MIQKVTLIGKDIALALHLLMHQEVVAIPTESVYGLAGNALDPIALEKIFHAKGRPHSDPLIVHIPDIDAAKRYAAIWPDEASRLAHHYWPGPLTLVLPKRPIIPDLATAGSPRVALRLPAHPLTQSLLRQLAFPLAAPSANPFGYISPTSADHVHDQLAGKIPYILDGGRSRVGLESTILGWDGDRFTLLRPGGIAIEALEALLGYALIEAGANEAAPGNMADHYMPHTPLYLGDPTSWIAERGSAGVAALRFSLPLKGLPLQQQQVLSRGGLAEGGGLSFIRCDAPFRSIGLSDDMG